jgi:O-antigen ligase
MSFLGDYDILILILLSFIFLLIAISIFFCSLKRYELAVTLILLSPWIHWLFTSNVQKNVEESMAVGLGTYMRISMVALAGVIGVSQFLKSRSNSHKGVPFYLTLLGGFVLYALLSTVYSIEQRYTLVRSSEFIFFFGFLLGFHCWLKDKTRLNKTLSIYFMIMTCGILLNVIALVLFPERVWWWRVSDRCQGLLDHPNTLGAFCMLSYPVLMWKYPRLNSAGKVLLVLLFCIVLFIHILSGSRASLATSLFGFFLWFLILNRADLYSLAKVLSLALIIFFGVVVLLQSRPSSFRREVTGATNLTGRTEFWRGCVQLIKERPLMGYGYGVGGKIWDDPRFHRSEQFLWAGSAKSSLHNGYLSMAIGLGIIGLLLWLSLIFIPIWRVMCIGPCGYKTLVVVMLFQGLLLNCFETSIASGSQIITSLVFWLFLIIAGRLPFLLSSQRTGEIPAVSLIPTRRKDYAA